MKDKKPKMSSDTLQNNNTDSAALRAALVKKLAQQRQSKRDQATTDSAPAKGQGQNGEGITPTDHDNDCYPLSFAQQRLWLFDQIQPLSPAYNLPLAQTVRGLFNLKAAELAVNQIIERHESLRTVIVMADNQPLQKIIHEFDFTLNCIDLTHLSGSKQSQKVKILVNEDAKRGFDLSQDLMIRISYLKLVEQGPQSEGILLFNMHHIASDAHSMGLFIELFIRAYSSNIAAQNLSAPTSQLSPANPLPPLKLQYHDFACWQRQQLNENTMAGQLDYWSNKLKNVPMVHQLPLDQPRPSERAFVGGLVRNMADSDTQQGVLTLAKQLSVSPFVLLHSALALVLARHSSVNDVVIGTPVSHRHQPGLESLIGFFVNTLVLRVDCQFSRLDEFVAHVKQQYHQALAHQDVPVEQVIDHLQIPRRNEYAALFQIMFSLDGQGEKQAEEATLDGLSFEPLEREAIVARFDLDINAHLSAQGLVFDWIYDQALFNQSTIETLSEHVINVLEAMISNIEAPVATLPMLSATEREQLLTGLNPLTRHYPDNASIAQLFTHQAQHMVEAVALQWGEQTLSYGALEQQSNQLAHWLMSLGVREGSHVGIGLVRGFDLIIGMLGVLKAGGAYVPFDPSHPMVRIGQQLQDAGVKVVLATSRSHSDFAQLAQFESLTVLNPDTDTFGQTLGQYPSTVPPSVAQQTEQTLACIMYTSGSTGLPKGVMVNQRNIIQLVVGEPAIVVTEQDRVVYCANPAFDASTWEIYIALLNGARLVIVDEAVLIEPQAFSQLLVEAKVSVLQLTAGLLGQMAYTMADKFAGLNYLLFGGDKADIQAIEHLVNHGCPANLVQTYGPTETVAFATSAKICADGQLNPWFLQGKLPIGRPVSAAVMLVLDDNLQLVPKGCRGQLYIGGDGVTSGYLNQAKLSAESFIDNPFGAQLRAKWGEKLYKSGDHVRMLADGQLEFIERIDQQLKLRGYRIELGEIEQALNQMAEVSSCLVVAISPANGVKRLCAYVVCSTDEGQIKQQLAKVLPEHMVPDDVVLLSSWPLTNNGKVDRKALPVPGSLTAKALMSQTPAQKPVQNQMQQDLLTCFAKVVSKAPAQIGIDDDFFTIGGNSLLAIRLIGEVAERLGLHLTIKQLFASPTIAQLANELQLQQRQSLAKITALGDKVDRYELSFAQQRLWFIDEMQGSSGEYNMPMALRVSGDFDLNLASAAMSLLIERHRALRTVIKVIDDVPYQHVLSDWSFTIEQIDLSDLSEPLKQQRLNEVLAEQGSKPFDLAVDLMVRAHFIGLSENVGVLLLNTHHIASDGWSMAIMNQEFIQCYQALKYEKLPDLPALEVHYGDYAMWQRERLQGEVYQQQLDYWATQLADISELHSLPIDKLRPLEKSHEGQLIAQVMPESMASQLNARATALGVTPFMLFHGALAWLLSQHGNSHDIVIGTPVANRNHRQIESLIGFFANTLVLRVNTEQADMASYFEHIKRVNVEALSHQDVPFDQLIELANITRSAAHSPLFQIMLTLDEPAEEPALLDGVQFSGIENQRQAAKFDLNVAVQLGQSQLEIAFIYDQALFSHSHMAQLHEDFVALLTVLAQPEQPLPLLSQWLTAQQQPQKISTPFEPEINFYQRFEQQVKANPDAIALEHQGQSLSYQQLSLAVDQLAATLVLEHKLNLADKVAIFTHCNFAMVIAVLGISKAGGVYVPLDVDAPQARLNHIITDTKARLVCTEAALVEHKNLPQSVQVVVAQSQLNGQVNSVNPNPNSNPNMGDCTVQSTTTELAYVLYTSGSTGLPKGVKVSHRSLNNYLSHASDSYLNDNIKQALVTTPLAFDATITSLLTPLVNGLTAVLIAQPTTNFGALSEQIFNAQEAKLFKLTPAHLAAITAMQGQPLHSTLPHQLVVGGEQLSVGLVRLWLAEYLPQATFYNEYGPTEATVGCSVFKLDKNNIDSLETAAVPIGKPIQNTQLYVFGADQQLKPKQAVGELFIGGEGVSQGYMQLPDVTAQRFITNPYDPSDTLYASGDLVRYLANGDLLYLGRADQQLKLNGLRIEPGEIEACLLQHPQVKSAAVVAKTLGLSEGNNRAQLVAYIVAPTAEANLFAQLKSHLGKLLPNYMVPQLFVALASLPLTGNGKLDQKRLPLPQADTEFRRATTEVEQQLVELWAKLLKLDSETLSIDSNFFALGGDSILSIQLVSRAARSGLHFSAKDLFDCQTIKTLSTRVKQGQSRIISQQPSVGQLALLPIQQHFFTDETDVDHYNLSVLLTVSAQLQLTTVKAMVSQLIARHDALRVAFSKAGDGWQGQFVTLSPAMLEQMVTETELEGCGFEHLEAYANKVQRQLDIGKGQLLRVALVRQPGQSHSRLLVVVHHLVVDGVSWRIILDDLALLYRQSSLGQAFKLANKTSGLQQWNDFIGEYKNSAAITAQLPYWRDVVATEGVCLAKLAPAKIQSNGQQPSEGYATMSLDESLTGDLLGPSHKKYRTQINELLLSALLLAVQRFSGECAVRIDLEGHGREALDERFDLSQTVGWFTTVYPVLLQARSQADIAQVICLVKENLRGIPNHGIGFGIAQQHGLDEKIAQAGGSELVFNYLGQFDGVMEQSDDFAIAGESSGQNISANRAASHPLALNGMVAQGCLNFSLTYDQNVYNKAKMQQLMDGFASALAQVVNHCIDEGAGRLTPSDFPLSQVSWQQLDQWQNQYDIADLYPATQMQQGLLFHALQDVSSYVSQTLFDYASIDNQKLKQAWQSVVARHDVLRTSFVGIGTENCSQLVHQSVELSWLETDLSHLEGQAQQQAIEQLLSEQIERMTPQSLPLMQFLLYKTAEQQYTFVWTHHHALLDGWCLPIVFSEVAQVYRALCTNEAPQLKEVVPYGHYMRWLAAQDNSLAVDFWQQKLADIDEPTPLPMPVLMPGAEKPVISQTERSKGHHQLEVSFDLQDSQAIASLARKNNSTVNVVMQAAWSLLLSRYANQQQVVFGAVTSGRPANLPGVENMLGLFINSIPMVIDVDGQQPVGQWLQQIHRQMVEADVYNYLPLANIQPLAGFNRPLFDSLLVFENYPVDEVVKSAQGEGGLALEQMHSREHTTYALCVSAQMGQQLRVKIQADQNQYSEAGVAQLQRHLSNLLKAMAAGNEQAVNQLVMLDANEQQYLLDELNSGNPDKAELCLLQQRFEAMAVTHADKPAVVFGDTCLSYQALNEQANQLAMHLSAQGVGPDVLVGIAMPTDVLMIVAVLGVLKAGGAYVPLDISLPTQRLEHMVKDAQLAHLIGIKNSVNNLSLPVGVKLTYLDDPDITAQLASLGKNNLPAHSQQSASSLAYVVYTSGSTGLPKGVALEQGLVVNLIDGMGCHDSVLTEPLSMTQYASFGFDMSVTDTFMTLFSGGCLYLVEQNMRLDIARFVDFISEKRIERLNLPYVVVAQLASLCVESNRLLEHLKVVISTAEALHITQDIRDFFTAHPNCQLINHYGPSETHVVTTCRLAGKAQDWPAHPPIGRVLPNLNAYVVDRDKHLVPFGSVGELYIGGVGVARGYVGQPQLTAQKFIQHRFERTDGAVAVEQRLYATGDLVGFQTDGSLAYFGRNDFQVKIRGFRVELGEIEQQLSRLDKVTGAVVVCQTDEHDLPRLVAYVVTQFDEVDDSLFTQALRQQLADTLPSYMVPSFIVVLDALPLTNNGKVDRRKLPKPDFSRPTDVVKASSEAELALVKIWAGLLKRDEQSFGVNDNFFDLGGHSLLAVRLITQINRHMGLACDIATIFEQPTIAQLANVLDSNADQAVESTIEVLPRTGEPFPLSFAQQRLWFIDRLEGGSSAYNLPLALQLSGHFDVNVAEQALQCLIARHESLRTVFVEVDGQPMQQINAHCDFAIGIEDLSGLEVELQQRQLEQRVNQHASEVFDLAVDPMIRCDYIKLSATDELGVLLFNIHHIASDGWSMGVLMDEFIRAYQALINARQPQFEPLAIQYADYAQWHRNYLQGEQIQSQIDYWLDQLKGIPTVHGLALDRARPTAKQYLGDVVNSQIDPTLFAGLQALAKRHNMTVFMLLHAGVSLVLARNSNANEFVVGTSSANRTQPALEGLIGYFINTLVLRVNTDFERLDDYLEQVKAVNLAAQSHQDIAFEQLVELCQLERSGQHSPLFQVMFNTNNNQPSDLSITDLSVQMLQSDQTPAKFDIEIIAQINADSGELNWVFDVSIFDFATIARMSEQVIEVLGLMVAAQDQDNDVLLTDVNGLPANQQRQLTRWLQGEVVGVDQSQTLVERFEHQVQLTPDATAVSFDNQILTYQALNQQANQLARFLTDHGGGHCKRVGICLEPSLETPMAVLGVLKAGFAYVPMDPHHPIERLQSIIEQAELTVVLTQYELMAERPFDQLKVMPMDANMRQVLLAKFDVQNLGLQLDPVQTSAYIIYTSGSTGKPKGVEIRHDGLNNYLDHALNQYFDHALDGAVVSTPLCFDATVTSLLTPLLAGKCVKLIDLGDGTGHGDLTPLARCIFAAEQPWLFKLTPAHLQGLSFHPQARLCQLSHCLVIGGEQLDRQLIESWQQQFLPQGTYVNEYGPTETVVGCITHTIEAQPLQPSELSQQRNAVAIGKPIQNCQLMILDEQQLVQPIGVAGELYIAIDGMSPGYVGQPQLTNAAFSTDFVADQHQGGKRYYRTGDKVRLLGFGQLEFVERVDEQVKLRGYRIEVGDICAHLNSLEQVASSAVVLREDQPGKPQLVAYLVLAEDIEGELLALAAQLRSYLLAHLPTYMIPAIFQVVAKLPLTINGKLDKKALPVPNSALSQGDYQAPVSDSEKTLVDLWGQLLNLDPSGISTTTNFFDIGGHSLLAVQLSAQLRERLGVEIEVKDIFELTNIVALAQLIDNRLLAGFVEQQQVDATIQDEGFL